MTDNKDGQQNARPKRNVVVDRRCEKAVLVEFRSEFCASGVIAGNEREGNAKCFFPMALMENGKRVDDTPVWNQDDDESERISVASGSDAAKAPVTSANFCPKREQQAPKQGTRGDLAFEPGAGREVDGT